MSYVPAGLILVGACLAMAFAGVIAYLMGDDRVSAVTIWRRLTLAILAAALLLLLGWYIPRRMP
jgi:hypothetical protein